MTKLSPARASVALLPGLECVHRGKVRDTYHLDDDHFLVVATDGVSIFDFVLNALVSQKGQALTAMSHFWLSMLEGFGVKTHLVAAGAEVDQYLPEDLRGNPELLSRSLVVRSLQMAPVEFVARVYLTGSSLKPYREDGTVCGHSLPPGLEDGDILPYILDTPTTKAVEGHDLHLDADGVRARYPAQTYTLIRAFQIVSVFARARGIVLADTKLEFGEDGTLGDEAFTPDSSRFWLRKDWEASRGASSPRRAPTAYDKQMVREWGKLMGVDKLDPMKPCDVDAVHELVVPQDLLNSTTQTYQHIFWLLTGKTLEQYWADLGVELPVKATAS